MSSETNIVDDHTGALSTSTRGAFGRLIHGETAFNFHGRRWIAFSLSLFLILVTFVSVATQGLNLGLDFKGGVAWQLPIEGSMTEEAARGVLDQNDIRSAEAKIQILDSASARSIRIQVGDQPIELRQRVAGELAQISGVDVNEVSVDSVSSSWGRSITEKALRALLIFIALVTLYLAWRFEWRMSGAAILAMLHDVVISVGIYSVFGFEVSPATVVAFLTILGYSLYDTIVVFDRVQENVAKYSTSKLSMADISNVSMNQVLMRSLNTTISALLPVLSILVLGAGIMGAVSLRDFAVALFVGMLTGSYSSIFVATPLLTMFKQREPKYAATRGQILTGGELQHMVITGHVVTRAKRRPVSTQSSEAVSPTSTQVLNHPPRPRKKKRR